MEKLKDIMKKIWDSNYLKAALILTIIMLILFDYYGLSLFCERADYNRLGTIGDWFSNLATLFTVILAAITIVNDKRLAEEEKKYNLKIREEDQKDRNEEKEKKEILRSQAVYAWVTAEQDLVANELCNFKISISNKTSVPIFEWYIDTVNEKKICSSKINGPVLPEILMKIDMEEIDLETDISISYLSFLGKWWTRSGADVMEASNE